MRLAKGKVTIGVHTRFGPNWPGIRCLAKTRRGTECQSAAYKHNGRCRLPTHGGLSTGARNQEGVQRISEANFKHGRQANDKLAAQRHAAKVRRRVRGELKRIEGQLFAAVKRCVSAIINDTHFYLARLCYLVD
jgi:hypothetical protein